MAAGLKKPYRRVDYTQITDSSGNALTATPAELNKLDGVTATAAELNLTDGLAAGLSITPAAGASANVCEVTIQVQDAAGASLSGIFTLAIVLSDAATGVGLTGTAASGTVQAKSASGTDLGALTAKKALMVQTLADGSYVLEITDTENTEYYIAASIPSTGVSAVSAQLETSDYGT
jgi:hypothetical protein